MRNIFLVLVVILIEVLCFSGTSFAGSDKAVLPFSVVASGNNSGYDERTLLLVETREEWETVWATANSRVLPAPPLPRIDFQTHFAAAVFMGQKPTGGYSVHVDSIIDEGNRVVIFLRDEFPPEDAMLTQALTQPWQVVVFERTCKPVFFKTLE